MDRNDPFLRAFALLAFVLVVAGATALAYDAIGTGLSVDVDPVDDRKVTAPGSEVAFPVAVRSPAEGGLDLELAVTAPDGLEAEAPPGIRAPAGNGTGFWVNVSVAEDAPTGIHDVRLNVTAGEQTRIVSLPVRVEEPDQTVERGQTASVKYVARYPNGSIFATNIQAVDESPMPKTARYSSPSYNALSVPTAEDASFLPGLKNGVVGVGVGHDLTLTLQPHQAYGNDTVRVEEPRTENVSRIITEPRIFNLSRDSLEQQGILNRSSEEGDVISIGEPPQVREYRVDFLNATHAELVLVVEEGDRQTHHTQWPDSSVAVEVNDTHARYRVEPPHDQGETFTWHDHWPNATTIAAVGDENITLRHSPEVGTTYNDTVQQQRLRHTVVDLTEDAIVVERANTQPLAGETLVFDVRIVEVSGG